MNGITIECIMPTWVVVAHSFHLLAWDAEAGESLCDQGQPGVQSEIQDEQDCYTEKLCL